MRIGVAALLVVVTLVAAACNGGAAESSPTSVGDLGARLLADSQALVEPGRPGHDWSQCASWRAAADHAPGRQATHAGRSTSVRWLLYQSIRL